MSPTLLRLPLSLARPFGLVLFAVLAWSAASGSAYAEEAAPSETAPVEVVAPATEDTLPGDEAIAVAPTPAEAVEAVEAVVEDEAVAVVVAVVVEPDIEPAAAAAPTPAAVVVVEEAPAATAASHSEPAVHQCNDDTFPTSAGWEASCDVLIENTLGGDGATSSRVTTTWCLAEAGVLPPEGCDTDVVTSNSLVTTVNQCNGILAGGSNVTCTVEVVNNVPFATPTTGVTVNQCVGSGQGGVSPGGPPTNCDPVDSSTTGATVTQCNGSANGGGAPERVQCSVTGGTSALPVTVNQCNGSTAAGSTVTCDVVFTNNFAAAAVDTDTVTETSGSPVVVPTPLVSTPSGGAVSTPVALVSQPSSSTSLTSLPATGPSTSTVQLVAFAAMALLFGALLLAGSKRHA